MKALLLVHLLLVESARPDTAVGVETLGDVHLRPAPSAQLRVGGAELLAAPFQAAVTGRPARKVRHAARKVKKDMQDSEKRAPECAVVFNAGTVLKWSDGARVDSFERVYRFNMAPLQTYERFVGHRTTHEMVHFVSGERAGENSHLAGFASPAEFFAAKANQTIVGLSMEYGDVRKKYERLRKQHSNWVLIPESFGKECSEEVGSPARGGHTGCSSGMATIRYARQSCGKVVVFGMDVDPCYPYHYWEDGWEDRDSCKSNLTVASVYADTYAGKWHDHDIPREHELLERWVREGKLEIAHYSTHPHSYKAPEGPDGKLKHPAVGESEPGLWSRLPFVT